MTDGGKRWIVFGYALTYAVGISACNGMSTVHVMITRLPDPNPSKTMIFIAAAHFAMLLGYALCFVLFAATLDFLTKRSPQPINALSLGLAALATIDVLLLLLYLDARTSYVAMRP
jgi:hypothetical protein